MKKIKALVLTGDGINCELETQKAFEYVGAHADIAHINEIIKEKEILEKYNILAIPGGFSYGDEIRSGKILSLKIKRHLISEFTNFCQSKQHLIIGICNGFQILTQLGVFEDFKKERSFTLSENRHGRFLDDWTSVVTHNSNCIWTKNLPSSFNLPVRHKEGRVVFTGDLNEQKQIFNDFKRKGLIALTYQSDINGSYEKIAGITNSTGNILGLMPHPEAAINTLLRPDRKLSNSESDYGSHIFKNAIKYLEETL